MTTPVYNQIPNETSTDNEAQIVTQDNAPIDVATTLQHHNYYNEPVDPGLLSLVSPEKPTPIRKTTSTHKRKTMQNGNSSRKQIRRTKTKSVTNNDEDSPEISDIMDRDNARSKVKEKRNSAVSHFNFYLTMKNTKLKKQNLPKGRTDFNELSFEDVDKGHYIGEFANYLATTAKRRINQRKKMEKLSKEENPSSPMQLQSDIWDLLRIY